MSCSRPPTHPVGRWCRNVNDSSLAAWLNVARHAAGCPSVGRTFCYLMTPPPPDYRIHCGAQSTIRIWRIDICLAHRIHSFKSIIYIFKLRVDYTIGKTPCADPDGGALVFRFHTRPGNGYTAHARQLRIRSSGPAKTQTRHTMMTGMLYVPRNTASQSTPLACTSTYRASASTSSWYQATLSVYIPDAPSSGTSVPS